MVENVFETRNPRSYDEVIAFTADKNNKIDVHPKSRTSVDKIQKIIGNDFDITVVDRDLSVTI